MKGNVSKTNINININMKILKNILNILLSFFLIITITAILVMNILENKILNKNYLLSKMDEVEFYLQISREVESGFENYIYQSGLPEDTIKNLFTEDMIKSDVESIVNCIYEGTDIVLSDEKVKETLDNKVKTYLKEQDIMLNAQGRENIKKFEELVIKEYTNNVNISSKIYQKGHEGIVILNKIDRSIGKVPIVITAVIIVLLIIINRKDLLNVFNYVGISLLSVGVLLQLGIRLIFNNVNFDNLMILSGSLSSLITNVIKEILYNISDKSIIFIVCGITGILVSAILKNIEKDKE